MIKRKSDKTLKKRKHSSFNLKSTFQNISKQLDIKTPLVKKLEIVTK